MQLLAINLGKQSFHIHGMPNEGEVISKKVTRSKLDTTVQDLSPETVAMEACASAHHWGRRFEAMGYSVRFIHPRFVMPFVKGSKNDAGKIAARCPHTPGLPEATTITTQPKAESNDNAIRLLVGRPSACQIKALMVNQKSVLSW